MKRYVLNVEADCERVKKVVKVLPETDAVFRCESVDRESVGYPEDLSVDLTARTVSAPSQVPVQS